MNWDILPTDIHSLILKEIASLPGHPRPIENPGSDLHVSADIPAIHAREEEGECIACGDVRRCLLVCSELF